jgi:hypothetical protein
MYRMGRIVVFTSVVRDDTADDRVPVQYLAEEVADRLLLVLVGTDSSTDARPDGPSGYRFDYERVVTIGDDQWPTKAEGVVFEGDVTCRVRIEQPGLTLDREYVSVDGTVWTRWPGQTDYEARGTAGAMDAVLLALCPAWPLHADDAGLVDALGGTPARYEVGGVPALGYRGTSEDLVSALGAAAGDTTVDVFNIWIAEGSSWLIELDLAVSGPTDNLTELIGTGYEPGADARVTVRHQVSDIGDVDPVIPPG